MRVTRSVTHKKPRVPSPVDSVSEKYDGEDSSQQRSTSLLNTIEDHLRKAQSEFGKFKHRMEALEKEKHDLRTDLKNANNMMSRQSHRGRANRRKSEDGIMDNDALRTRIEELELENQRQKKRIAKLKRKELEEEVEELLPNKDRKSKDDYDKVDTEDRMRKLLRKFSDLMSKTTISDDMSQTCPICFETLQLNESSAMQCQHLVCDICLPMLLKAEDETVKCPECREPTAPDEVETIYMTEQNRWDQLLEIARTWSSWDHQGQEETGEEEAEEDFIDDGISSEPRSERSEGVNETKNAQPPCGDGDHDPPTPPPCNNQLFSESPTKEKRRRMEQLAEQRAKKRKR